MFYQYLGWIVHAEVIGFPSTRKIARFALSNELAHCAGNDLLQIGILPDELWLVRESQP